MLKSYENTQVVFQTRRAGNALTWGKSVAETMSAWEVVLLEAAVVAKRTIASDPANSLKDWKFNDVLQHLRECWQAWCKQLCIKTPSDFKSLPDVWVCLLTHTTPMNMGSLHHQVVPAPAHRLGVNMLQEYCASEQDVERSNMLAITTLDALLCIVAGSTWPAIFSRTTPSCLTMCKGMSAAAIPPMGPSSVALRTPTSRISSARGTCNFNFLNCMSICN
jgi:hypothetical protein